MKKHLSVSCVVLLCFAASAAAKYEFKEISVKPANEYSANQSFQNVSIGAEVYNSREKVLGILDTKRLCERYFMAVLVVVENNNDFAVEVKEGEIFLIREDGSSIPTVSVDEVLLAVSLKKSPSEYRDPSALARAVNKDMKLDFERKAFGEKLIAPHSSDHGLVFFPLLEGAELERARLYFPELKNMSSGESLMFFEFALGSSSPPPSQ